MKGRFGFSMPEHPIRHAQPKETSLHPAAGHANHPENPMQPTASTRTAVSSRPGFMLVALLTVSATMTMSADTAFPGWREAWPKATPESQGMSSGALRDARALMRTDSDGEFTTMNMIIIRNGRDVWHYGNPYDLPRGSHLQKDWASCGRSLMTTMYGMVMKENGMHVADLERPAGDVFHSYTARALDRSILARHLLSYTACANPPGSGWAYACEYFTMHRILRDMDGQNPMVRLGRLASMIDADWQPFEYWGHKLDTPFLTIVATESEAARWGYLWLHRGNWRGTQVVDEAFVAVSLQPVPSPLGGFAHANEGMQIHINYGGAWGDLIPRDAYAAFGAGGKVIFVCPSLNLVIAATMQPSPYQRRMVGSEMRFSIQKLIEPVMRCIDR